MVLTSGLFELFNQIKLHGTKSSQLIQIWEFAELKQMHVVESELNLYCYLAPSFYQKINR